jgi:hypothetical protein
MTDPIKTEFKKLFGDMYLSESETALRIFEYGYKAGVETKKQEPGYTTTRNAWTGRVTYKCNICGKDNFRSDHAAKFHVHACQAPAVQTKQWSSLTQTEIDNLALVAATKADIRDIEAKLKEKNHVS